MNTSAAPKSYISKYWRKHKWMFILGVLLVASEAVCDLFQPRLMALLVDEGAMKGSLPEVWHYGTRMIGIALAGLVFALSRNYIATQVSQRFGAELRLEMFSKIQSMTVDELDSFEEGSLITRQTNDITQLQNFVAGLMRIVVRAPVVCIGAIIMAIAQSFRVVPVIFPIVAIAVIIISVCMKIAYPRYARVQAALDRLNGVVREYLAGVRLVKAFRRFKGEEERFGSANTALTQSTVEANRILVLLSPLITFFINIGIAVILWLGAAWVDYGEMQVGQIMAFVSYMTQILMSINIISNILNIFVRVRASHYRIAGVLETGAASGAASAPLPAGPAADAPLPRAASHALPPDLPPDIPHGPPHDPPHVEFRGVSFSYRNSTGEPALRGISFKLGKGETLGIIGPTGSGKTSLTSLLMRFYEPTEGHIYINGTELKNIDEAEIRSHIAIVPQTPTLFYGTIRENISWGKPDASDDEILRAAGDAQALDFITDDSGDAAAGLRREVGQTGTGLSGGQKQRISIARALIRNPGLLILDDCTSALDVITETAVKDALSKYTMTTLLITQRVMTVRRCDKILVLENGMQAGFGTHGELIASCPVYRDIYQSQVGEDS